jgi:hypothetical protein
MFRFYLDLAGFNLFSTYKHSPGAHLFSEVFSYGLLHPDQIFFFMVVLLTQDMIDYIAIVGQEDEAAAIFVQSAYREYALRMIDKIDDIGLIFQICGAGDPYRLIEYNIGKFLFGCQAHAIYGHYIAFVDHIRFGGWFIIELYPPLSYEHVCFPSGAVAGAAYVFIYADCHYL